MLQLKLNLAFALKITFGMYYCFCLVMSDENLRQCYKCDSRDGDNCLINLANVTIAENCVRCFTEVDKDGKVSRGCVSANTTKNCNDDGKCRLCTTGKCNDHIICKDCVSNENNPGCAQTIALKRYNSVCSRSNNACITMLNNHNEVERKCGTSEKCDGLGNDKCVVCKKSACNTEIFPQNRIRCFQCSGEECANKLNSDNTSDVTSLLPCRLYDSNEKCYISGNNEKDFKRGCLSDFKDTPKCENCSYCTETACNNRPYKRSQGLSCLQCNDCSDEQKAENAEACKNQLLYSQEEACYIELLPNKTVQRGCLHDRTNAQGAVTNCTEPCTVLYCKACNDRKGCNDKEWVVQDNGNGTASRNVTCIRCRSDLEPKCVAEAQKLPGEKCMSETSNEMKEDCYTGIWNDVIIRDCLTNASDRQKAACLNGNDRTCVTCSGNDCNNAKASAKSTFAKRDFISVLTLCFALSILMHVMS